jgi:hypothetical protein
MFPWGPADLLDMFAFASAGSITLGTAWFLAQLAKTIVPSVVDYLSRRRLVQTIEKLAASPPAARIELTSQGFVFDPRLPACSVPPPPVLSENVTALMATPDTGP